MKDTRQLRLFKGTCLILIFLVLISSSGLAQVAKSLDVIKGESKFPGIMAYEGYITNEEGNAVPNGNYDFVFSIYTSKTGGTAIWIEEHRNVSLENGIVQLYLGRGSTPNPLNLPFDQPYYLGVRIADNSEMTPRIEMTPAGYSFRSKYAENVADNSITSQKIADNAVTDDKIESVSWGKIKGAPANVQSADAASYLEERWMITGNVKTNPPLHFLGTTDEKDLVFKTNSVERLKLTKEGKVVVDDDVYMDDDNMICVAEDQERIIFDEDGNDIDIMGADVGIGTETPEAKFHVKATGRFGETETNHIALFENTEDGDGVAIKINRSVPNNTNNFLSFLDSNNGIVGRIEGQDLPDLFNSWEFIWNTLMFAIEEVLIIAGAEASNSEEPSDEKEAAAAYANGAVLFAHYLEWIISSIKNIGVYFGSGSGDYAECLLKLDIDEAMQPGDIVGIYGGKISKSTQNADQLLVVSLAPIILGNMPPDANKDAYEKVAFMGQVPVKVNGSVEAGDYIIPSGLNDGSGIAIAPEMMTADEFSKVVGRAWGDSEQTSPKMINMAIGLQSGDLAKYLDSQMKNLLETKSELTAMKAEMQLLKNAVKQIIIENNPNQTYLTSSQR